MWNKPGGPISILPIIKGIKIGNFELYYNKTNEFGRTSNMIQHITYHTHTICVFTITYTKMSSEENCHARNQNRI